MVDYRKFDIIDCSDSEDEKETVFRKPPLSTPLTPSTIPPPPGPPPGFSTQEKPPPVKMASKGKEGRFKFEYEGRTIYEWEQVYIAPYIAPI